MSNLLEQINNIKRINLGSISHYVVDKIDVSELSLENYVSTENMISERRGIEQANNLPATGKVTRFEMGDTLTSNIRPYFKKIWKATRSGGCSNDVLVIRINNDNDFDKNFLYYVLSDDNFFAYSVMSSRGTKMPRGDKDAIMEYKVPLPDLPTQKKIASIFGAYDEKIENNNKIIKNLELTAQTIFNEWFVNFKFPGCKKVKMVESEMGEIPEGWNLKKISEVAYLNKGISYTSAEINTEQKGVALINLGNFLRGGGFNSEGTKYYTGEYKSTHIVKPGQILIAMTDLTSNREVIGHPARLPENFKEAIISLDVCSLNPKKEIYIEFIYNSMLRRSFSKLMASCASGTNVSHLKKENIEGYDLIFPEESLLVKFNNLAQPIFTKQAILEEENEKLKQSRDQLLVKLV